ncbi:MAG TPA: helix-turn-helix transcriptional regulator [Chitinophagaceae bacterium]|nr:helix-turn-helix transcriptional regulator [Chitinophagaceae bacterium]
MLELNYSDSVYTDFIQTCARLFNTRAEKNHLTIPANYGKGFLSSFMLSEGISGMIGDTVFNDDLLLHRSPTPNHQFFILQFNETSFTDDTVPAKSAEKDVRVVQQNMVLLTNSLIQSKFLLPANTRVRTAKLIFEKQHLLNLLNHNVVDAFVSYHFAQMVKKVNTSPIDAGYRLILNDLLKNSDDHPLRTAFIQNRILLLLERFLMQFMEKVQHEEKGVSMRDDEIARLVKVESLLVKDFSVTPPTISDLSKISAMSPTKLKKDFKAMYGLPVYEYYQKNRMMRAKDLLLEEKYAIKQVGMMVGYSNLGHFAASFKKEFGILPSELFDREAKSDD